MTYSEAVAAVESLSDEDKVRLAERLREELFAPLAVDGEAHLKWLETGEGEPWCARWRSLVVATSGLRALCS